MLNDPTDTTAFTPAHFLIGETLTAPPDVNADRNEKSLLKRWELLARILEAMEDNIPVMSWPMGRIVKKYPGQDNHVRVVDVKTASGIFKRPITRLAPIFPEEMANKRPITEAEDTNKPDAPLAQRKRLMSPTISSSLLILLLMLPLVLTQQGLHQTSVYDYLCNKLQPLPKAEESTLDHNSRTYLALTTQLTLLAATLQRMQLEIVVGLNKLEDV
ncbi:hypothetical protein ACLKA7_000912 [Drosophila subpalustris]